MNLRTGTSGFSYKEWKGAFYPEDLPAKKMLEFYGGELPAVEINNTFYRLPKKEVIESWASQVPDDFRFSIKASRRITHMRRLKGAHEETEYLLRTLEALGDKLGVVLFQLPPFLKKGAERLGGFLELLPAGTPAAFEFRDPSWFDEEIFGLLEEKNCALCIADTGGESDAPVMRTAPLGYVRLRRPAYSRADLERWRDSLSALGFDELFVFFKHEDEGAGPRMAKKFLELPNQG